MRAVRAGLVSALFHLCGDAIAQAIEKKDNFQFNEYVNNFDYKRFFFLFIFFLFFF